MCNFMRWSKKSLVLALAVVTVLGLIPLSIFSSQPIVSAQEYPILIERGPNFNRYYNPTTGTYAIEVSGLINYEDSEGTWHPIDTTIESASMTISGNEYIYGMTHADYNVYYRERSSQISGRPIAFIRDGYAITLAPSDPLKFDDGTLVSGLKNVAGAVSGSGITYPTQYDEGIDLRYVCVNYGVIEQLIIDNVERLGSPNEGSYLVKKETVRVYSLDNEDSSMGILYGKDRESFKAFNEWENKEITTSEEIWFTDENGNVVFFFPKAYARDNAGDAILLSVSMHMTLFGNLRVEVSIPWSWLESAVYPVVIDPSVSLDDPTEDGYIDYDGYVRTNDSNYLYFSLSVPHIYRSYVEWDVSSIPDAATITNTIFKYHGKQNDGDAHIHEMLGARPSTSGNQDVFDEAEEGTVYVDPVGFPEVGTGKQVDLGANADSDLQGLLGSDWFAIGIQHDTEMPEEAGIIYSEEYASADPKPTLYVEYTPGNAVPEVLNSFTPATVDPNTAFDVKVEVRDNDNISDIEEVWLKVYENTKTQGDADDTRDHYTFKWVRAGDDNWFEVGPDGTSPYDHLVVASCSAGSDTENTDNFTFNIKLGKTASPNNKWNVWVKVMDNASEQDNQEFSNKFDVNDYISVQLDDSTLTFSGSVGQSDVVPSEQPTTVTVSTNVNFDVKVKLSGDWTGPRGGTIPMANTQAAQDASHTGEVVLSSTYQAVWSSVGYGEDVQKDVYWFLDIPSPCLGDEYSTTVYVSVVKS